MTVVGEPDPVTGMVMNISDLKKIIKTQVMDQLDHKNIDKQVDYFRDKVRIDVEQKIDKNEKRFVAFLRKETTGLFIEDHIP